MNEATHLHCIQFYNWTQDSARVEEVSPVAGPALEPDQYIYNAPLANGCLLFCIRVPEDYPGGKRAFAVATESFLETRENFCIRAVYLDEAAIEDFLAKLKDNFKAQSKAKGKGNKGKAAKGKHVKWKNPTVKFGCRVVWAHDLIQPQKLYLRVKSLERDAAALFVVDTSDEAYKFNFNSDKVISCPAQPPHRCAMHADQSHHSRSIWTESFLCSIFRFLSLGGRTSSAVCPSNALDSTITAPLQPRSGGGQFSKTMNVRGTDLAPTPLLAPSTIPKIP
jgi:hypothetical protein